ncbi:unnamed protein product [Cuscuta campestris]|uniref:Uncharacterized protein n=1 Tax=Cuscuta campestris TaxID=132261 RepID=A0A484LAU7_9ASTE|nr:unnamed protein product [Cuscuta campestris]
MAGIAILLDLLRTHPSLNGQTLHSYGLFSSKVAASAAKASLAFAATTPFAYRPFVGYSGARVAFCDAGQGLTEDYISSLRSDSTVNVDDYSSKIYIVEQKALLSAFHWRNFALTFLRSFLYNYLPIVESRLKIENAEDDDGDFLEDDHEERPVDLITPFKASVKHICRETTVTTTRRVLERFAVHYVSQRMAWKLLKDVPRSAARKAGRGMPTFVYICSVSRTTFRGCCLGVLASLIVQVGVDIYGFFKSTSDNEERLTLLGKKVYNTTLRCAASLVLASIGAGIGAAFIQPTTGQWIGCALGDIAGPYIVAMLSDKVHLQL